MARTISEKRKREERRGTGEGAEYRPWILARELNSTGTTANIIDWKHGRQVQLLSAGEEMYYYFLRWDDAVIDIREQYPLDKDETKKIARSLGIRHPSNTMTTDLLVTKGKTHVAYSVKSSRKDVDYTLSESAVEEKLTKRTAEKLAVEKVYWQERGIEWKLVFKEDLDPVYINNIRRAVVYYNKASVHDAVSYIKHLIATKSITVDMSKPIDYQNFIQQYM